MLITSCMRSGSSSMHEFLRTFLNLEKGLLRRPPRNWRAGEGVEGYMHYPSSTAVKLPPHLLKSWVIARDMLVQEHILPIQYHRDILMKIPLDLRKVVVMKRDALESFESQMRRKGTCHYETRAGNRESCRAAFIKFREDVDIMFPEKDGFLHIDYEDLKATPDAQVKRVLDYWGFDYGLEDNFTLPRIRGW